MTNFEKYRKEIEKLESKHKLAIDLDGNIIECYNLDCSDCKFNSLPQTCTKSRFDWLFSECKTELNNKEKALVENVGIAKDVHYRYIARDKDDTLTLFEKVPNKAKTGDRYCNKFSTKWFEIHNTLFPWIQFEDGVYDIETSQFINVE